MHHFDLIEGALPRLLWITNEPSGASHQSKWTMPCQLKSSNRQYLQQVAHMQTWRRWVEAAVERDRPSSGLFSKRVKVR